ncbi:MAG: GNAT family N-acetyltransferase [Desulfuromonas sp.]|nr:GNAT family N-acetyltransferase [Desulfuromonas thiophila]
MKGALPEHSEVASPLANSPLWQTDWARSGDEQALLRLFEQAFGHSMTPEQWRWKYASSQPAGIVVRHNGELVAFYGGMPRALEQYGVTQNAVQIGDVMVAPRYRRLLTRRGALFCAASNFAVSLVGPGKAYACAYGFPSKRHHQLGERLGLYGTIGRLLQARWSASPPRRHWHYRIRPLTLAQLPLVDQLWQEMKADLTDRLLLHRTATYIRQRFIDHPVVRYHLHLVLKRFTGVPVGLLVLRDCAPAGVELLDLVGRPAILPTLVQFARQITTLLGQQQLYCSLTSTVAQALQLPSDQLSDPDLPLPIMLWQQPPAILQTRDRWWLTGGDADYR